MILITTKGIYDSRLKYLYYTKDQHNTYTASTHVLSENSTVCLKLIVTIIHTKKPLLNKYVHVYTTTPVAWIHINLPYILCYVTTRVAMGKLYHYLIRRSCTEGH